MSLSRIYQGKISSLQVLTPTPQEPLVKAALASLDSPLFRHHAIYQDAVNYYHLCLVALAGEDTSRPLHKLRVQMEKSWNDASTDTEDSWRVKLAKWLGIPAASLFEAAIAKVLEGREATNEALILAGELLLNKIDGDIQQAGRGYWPRFCDPKANPTYDFSPTARASASGLAKLAGVIHAETPDTEALEAIAAEMDLSWTVKLQPEKTFTGEEARGRMKEAVAHFLKMAEAPPPKLAEVLARFPEGLSEWQALPEKIAQLTDEFEVPRNRKASPDLTFASLIFKHFPSPFTAAVLGLSVGKPKAAKAVKEVKVAARKKQNAATQAVVAEEVNFDFAALGDDPIKLARGQRGFVFPAFTSLPRWAVPGPHVPVWKEFDIAAFKEALKTVNQFKLKTAERNALQAEAARTLAYMNEESSVWKAADANEPGRIPPKLKSDPNFILLSQLLKDNGIANTATGGEQIERGIYQASVRGYYAIKKDWCEKWEKSGGKMMQDDLLEIVKVYQQDHKYDVGDVGLFRALCDPCYWSLWKPLTDDEKAKRDDDGRSKDIISDYRKWLEVKMDADRLKEPIRFTPAHAEHSRRLFMFSDISGSHGAEFAKDAQNVEISLAAEVEGKLQPVRAKVGFSAPRAARDQIGDLSGGGESVRWLQPMMKALGCPEPVMPELEKCAVALMPEIDRKQDVKSVRLLLNFPASVDPDGLIQHIGKQAAWYKDFNGTYKPRTMQLDTGISLYWPGMENAKATEDATAWWNRSQVRQEGIHCLSVDLGQRDAGAWALLETRCDGGFARGRKPFIQIGEACGKSWHTAVQGMGMFRLPGEDAKSGRVDAAGKRGEEYYGSAGRNASEEEWKQAQAIARLLGGKDAVLRLGRKHDDHSHPEQNGELLRIIGRAQSRLSRYHRWSCRLRQRIDATVDDILDYGEVDAELSKKALEAKEALKAKAEKHGISIEETEKKHLTLVALSKALSTKEVMPDEIKTVLAPQVDALLARLRVLIPELSGQIKEALITVANRELPLIQRKWVWKANELDRKKSVLAQTLRGSDTSMKKIQGQRGLSMARIEQIEDLRKRFMSLRRQLDLVPEVEVPQGVEERGQRMDEPCEDILNKLDRMKEQRVNQTAHLIIAQALGLRLRSHEESAEERLKRDIHGEYEVIPGRKPVDFIVMEDLSRYLSSQGRAPSENRRLMKWCHRAVLGKLKQMAEPFGIPVVEVPAAYSSRFCALSGVPGFRAVEVHPGNADDFRWKRLLQKAEKDRSSEDAQAAAIVFDQLRQMNIEIVEARERGEKKPYRTLLVPLAGGPIFVPMKGAGPRQADINAAINLGLRALASPSCVRARPKIRVAVADGSFKLIQDNKLEKAAALKLEAPKEPSKPLLAQKRTNFFVDEKGVAKSDRGHVMAGAEKVRVSGGMALWKAIKEGCWDRVAALNAGRVRKLGRQPPLIWQEAEEKARDELII
jgi:IS605 OrfB family transposase